MKRNQLLDRQKKESNKLSHKLSKHKLLIDRTYQTNIESDYTEKISLLSKNFNYQRNGSFYWGARELSTLYGTPLFDEASESQKLALNHLYWVGQYNYAANSEANTILYNQITEGVFAKFKDYKNLCRELQIESDQERYHIKAFQKIGYKTKIAIFGKAGLGNPFFNQFLNGRKSSRWQKSYQSSLEKAKETTLRFVTHTMLGEKKVSSSYLQQQTSNLIPTTNGGFAASAGSPSTLKFFVLNWGNSPFMAAQYYAVRLIANMSHKAYEHQYFKHFKKLQKTEEFIPTPLEVSYYHFLDESFHTTISQVIAQKLYQDFDKPTEYEKLVANLIMRWTQQGLLAGLSGGLPAVFRNDDFWLFSLYKLLRSSLFEMSSIEAIQWMEKCLCQENEGFHLNLKYHQKLLSEFRHLFSPLDYLWKVNRDMEIMAAGASIERAINDNRKDWHKFACKMNFIEGV